MSVHDGLVVVLPEGFDRRRVPAILEENRAWIERTRRRLEGRRMPRSEPCRLPSSIVLAATGETWQVEYRAGDPSTDGVRARGTGDSRLVLRGRVDDPEACREALNRWLSRRARVSLIPRLELLAGEHGLWFERASIRHQRSRWGSCSRRRTISLNARLLFFPPELVDYVLLHELCHTVELNHSLRFWRVLEEHCPGSAAFRRRLRSAASYIPDWLDAPLAGPPVPSAIPWVDL